jgi:GAF domain-containing protein
MINLEKFIPFKKEKEAVDLSEIYRRIVIFLDKNLSEIAKNNLEVLGDLQRNDLRTLIEKNRFTDPPLLHRLEDKEIEALQKYIEESESMRGYTVDRPTLVSALTKLRDTLKARLEGEKKY